MALFAMAYQFIMKCDNNTRVLAAGSSTPGAVWRIRVPA